MKKKATAFWDASALVPLCVHESATSAAVTLLKEYLPVVWWGSIVEIQSAICRLNRDKTITDAGKIAAVARLETLQHGWREISPGDRLRELALDLLSNYPLKAADGLQLAASLIWSDERPARRTFVCADQKLSKTARSIGFSVDDLSEPSSRK
jgi:predicted nucleic acid-binding protein